jgi:hypothetical protein
LEAHEALAQGVVVMPLRFEQAPKLGDFVTEPVILCACFADRALRKQSGRRAIAIAARSSGLQAYSLLYWNK